MRREIIFARCGCGWNNQWDRGNVKHWERCPDCGVEKLMVSMFPEGYLYVWDDNDD